MLQYNTLYGVGNFQVMNLISYLIGQSLSISSRKRIEPSLDYLYVFFLLGMVFNFDYDCLFGERDIDGLTILIVHILQSVPVGSSSRAMPLDVDKHQG